MLSNCIIFCNENHHCQRFNDLSHCREKSNRLRSDGFETRRYGAAEEPMTTVIAFPGKFP